MELVSISDLHFIDRNKVQGEATFKVAEKEVKAEYIFYLQGDKCLSIRLGRHDTSVATQDLEDFLRIHSREIREQTREDIINLRKARRLQIYGREEL